MSVTCVPNVWGRCHIMDVLTQIRSQIQQAMKSVARARKLAYNIPAGKPLLGPSTEALDLAPRAQSKVNAIITDFRKLIFKLRAMETW